MSDRKLLSLILGLILCLAPVAASRAQDADAESDAKPAAESAENDSAKKGKSLPTLEKVTEGMTEVAPIGGDKGLMTLYRYDESERIEDATKLLCRIPASLLDQDMLLALSVSRGQLAGFQWGDALVRWRLIGKKVVLEAPDARYVSDGDDPFVEAIRRTYRPTIVVALPIVTMVGSDPVVDLGEMLTDTPGTMPGGPGTPDRSLSHYTKIKVFPENMLIDVDLAVRAGKEEGHRLVGISYAFRKLPKASAFKPRKADERVGYFNIARQNWTLPHDAKETVQRYIHRWDLRKADPSLELSPPVKPIVFIVEDTVPLRWRHWVRAGVAEWNEAFEQLGFVDAIVVHQQTAENDFADVDPEDARYNFVRWITIGNPFALGPRRVDPRTGEILDADVIVDDAFLRAYQLQVEQFVIGQEADAMVPPEARMVYEQYPAFAPRIGGVGGAPEAEGGSALSELPPTVRAIALMDGGESHGAAHAGHLHAGSRCDMALGFKHQLAMAHLAMLQGGAGGRAIPDRLLGEIIKKIVTHEVGHALGLRHNFRASAWLGVDEIKRRRDNTNDPTSASVMDYAPLIFFKGDKIEELNHLTDPSIGPYDYWAIEYGYREPGAEDGGEAKMLSAIGARNTEPALHYQTDEDANWINSPDPLVARWDMSGELLKWATGRVELTDELIADVRQWALDEDDPAYYLRSTFNTLLRERAQMFSQVAHLVSGQYFSRNRLSDPNADDPFELIDPKVRREALAFLGESLFAEEFFGFDPTLFNDLSPVRWKDWATRSVSRLDYPLHQIILQLQGPSLAALITPPVLQRVYDSELKTTAEDKFTAAELLKTTQAMIWSELDQPINRPFTDARPMISSVRRNLQNMQMDMLTVYAEPGRMYYVSSDLHRMTRYVARQLEKRIDEVLTANEERLDFATRAHLFEARSRLQRMLEAEYSAR